MIRANPRWALAGLLFFSSLCGSARAAQQASAAMDRDLLEVSIPGLEKMYASRKYTVTQVTRWYLDRIARYDGVYRAIIHVDSKGALAAAEAEDAEAKRAGKGFKPGALWGVPMVVKSNTSVKGTVTNDGSKGYMIPGHELIAPEDARIVAKFRAAGAVIIGQTNMPDFAASDTNISSALGLPTPKTICLRPNWCSLHRVQSPMSARTAARASAALTAIGDDSPAFGPGSVTGIAVGCASAWRVRHWGSRLTPSTPSSLAKVRCSMSWLGSMRQAPARLDRG